MRGMIAFVTLAVAASGCTKWETVKPTELPKLNGSTSVHVGSRMVGEQRTDVIAVSVAHVEKPDGTLVKIEGEFDARVTESSGEAAHFRYPVLSSVSDADLTVQGSNRGKTDFELDQVERVEVSQPDQTATFFATLGISAAVVGLIALFVFGR